MRRENLEPVSRTESHGSPTVRTGASNAPAHATRSRRATVPAGRCASCEADPVTMTRLFDALDDLQQAMRLVARPDKEGMQAGPTLEASPLHDSPQAMRNTVAIPQPDEEVRWDAHLRADVPRYVLEQLRAEAYRTGRTAVSVVLQAMSAFHDDDGNAVFCIRERDMVADRRKGSWAESRKPVQSNPAG